MIDVLIRIATGLGDIKTAVNTAANAVNTVISRMSGEIQSAIEEFNPAIQHPSNPSGQLEATSVQAANQADSPSSPDSNNQGLLQNCMHNIDFKKKHTLISEEKNAFKDVQKDGLYQKYPPKHYPHEYEKKSQAIFGETCNEIEVHYPQSEFKAGEQGLSSVINTEQSTFKDKRQYSEMKLCNKERQEEQTHSRSMNNAGNVCVVELPLKNVVNSSSDLAFDSTAYEQFIQASYNTVNLIRSLDWQLEEKQNVLSLLKEEVETKLLEQSSPKRALKKLLMTINAFRAKIEGWKARMIVR